MKKRWSIKEPADPGTINSLASELGISKLLAGLLVQRGIDSFEKAKAFFRPQLSDLHDPFLMKDMHKAVDRVEEALQKKQKILVYGDYDVDGTTAVALMYSFLSEEYKAVDYYIPDRYAEGYGISTQGIDYAAANGVDLIIALDCGIKAVDKVAYANEKSIDFIICDHHLPGKTVPAAVAVLDPKQADCQYPYKELSGCGIGFKLVQAMVQRKKGSFDNLLQYLDLCAISIGCDIVPITGENRVLTYYGLKQLNKNPRTGIKNLLEISQVDKELTISNLVFIIGPRINAAGRIDHGKKAVELLVSDSDEDAVSRGTVINKHNSSRRDLDKSITAQALSMIEGKEALANAKSTVLYHKEWHKGVIGIVASRLIEKYYRPTIVLTESNGYATGSARSVKGFDVYDAIDRCRDLLIQFGGHKYAAGLTMEVGNIPAFTKKFEEIVSSSIAEDLLTPEVEIDAPLNFREITPKFYKVLRQFAPFGPENMKPVFMADNVMDGGYSKPVGKEGDHLKLDLVQNGDPKHRFSAIAFNMGHLYKDISQPGTLFEIAYTLEENEWNGKKSLQLKVEDIRV